MNAPADTVAITPCLSTAWQTMPDGHTKARVHFAATVDGFCYAIETSDCPQLLAWSDHFASTHASEIAADAAMDELEQMWQHVEVSC